MYYTETKGWTAKTSLKTGVKLHCMAPYLQKTWQVDTKVHVQLY